MARIQAGSATHLHDKRDRPEEGPDDMRLNDFLWLAAFAALLAAAPAQAQPQAPPHPAPHAEAQASAWARYAHATQVQLRDIAAYVRVTPQDRADVAVAVTNTGPLRAPEFRMNGERLVIDGKLRRQIRSCRARGADDFEVEISRRGRLSGAQLPTIEIRVPRDVVVIAGGAVRLHVGPSGSAQIRVDGCGDADIERVENRAEISVSGSPDLRLYDAGSAQIAVAGAGDVVLGVVRNGLTVSIAGAGDLTAARADGPTNIAVQGAGDVIIREGRATTLSIAIAGAGDVIHNGVADSLDAVIFGAGDVRVRRVNGEVSRRVLGVGEVIVGR